MTAHRARDGDQVTRAAIRRPYGEGVYPVEEWVALRRQGHTQAQIAAQYGVSPATVARRTEWDGPYLTGRSMARRDNQARWVADRRAGLTPAQISARDGVKPGLVSRLTSRLGPYPPRPAPDAATVADWVQRRRDGHSITSIAASASTSTHVVTAATGPFGPYPRPARRHPGRLTLADFERTLGLSGPAIAHWHRSGFLPEPDGHTARGHPYWTQEHIETWMATAGLQVCPTCGAHTKRLWSHHAAAHHE